MQGKIAVIESCHHCPYKAYDSKLGAVDGKFINESIVYCGYSKIGYDESQINLDKIINYEQHIESWTPSESEPDYPLRPKNCPLPDGEDGSPLFSSKTHVQNT